jgi:hypothetical protein
MFVLLSRRDSAGKSLQVLPHRGQLRHEVRAVWSGAFVP